MDEGTTVNNKTLSTRLPIRCLLALILVSQCIVAPFATAQTEQRLDINLPAQSLDQTLIEIGQAFDRIVVAPDELTQGVQAPRIQGKLNVQQAVAQALRGTVLAVEQTDAGALLVTRAERISPDSAASLDAAAPGDARELDTITVTARKREEVLQEVPMSLTVFDDEDILLSNLVTLEDYSQRTPNLSFQNNGGASRTIFTIRGVGGGNVASTGSPVALYVDEIILNPTSGLRQNDLALLDLERIEVLRGPQGTLYGRNTIGGAINLVTRKPNATPSARATLGAERFDTYFAQGHVNVPLGENAALLASAMYRESDGFIENPITGDDFAEGASGGRLALRLWPTDQLMIDLTAQQNEVRYDGLRTVTEANFDAGTIEIPVNFQPENEVDSKLYSARIEYSTPAFDIISLTSYNESDAPEGFDGDGTPAPIATVFQEIEQENFAQELRFQSNNPATRWQWLTGAYYGDNQDDTNVEIIVGDPANPLQQIVNRSSVEIENIALFGNLDILLDERWTLTLGARYSWDDFELVNTAGVVTSGSSEAFTPKVSLQYAVNDDLLTFATISRGYRPGGIDTSFEDEDLTDEVTSEFDEETAWNYELGANATWFDGRLIGRAAVFYLDYENLQSAFFLPGFFNTVISNAGSARSYGTELELTATPHEYWFFNASLGLLDTEFTDFDNTPQGDLTGNELPYAPNVNFSAVGEYRRPLFGNFDGLIRAEYSYRDEQEGRNDNNADERQPSFDLFHLRAGIASEHFELVAYVENLFDETYPTNRRPGGVTALGVTPDVVTPGDPRTWGVRATVRY